MKPKVISVCLITGTLFLFAFYHHAPHMISENKVTDELSEPVKYQDDSFNSLLSQATSGQEFSGLPFRTFPPDMRKFHHDTIIRLKKIPDSMTSLEDPESSLAFKMLSFT